MTTRRRAPERSLVSVTLAGLTALALGAGACRQTVLLDPTELADGGAGAGAGGNDEGGQTGTSGGPFDASTREGGGRLDGGFPNAFCAGGQPQPLLAAMRTPDLVLVVDRSSAMQSAFGATTRLLAEQQAVRALVQKYQHVVRFGYEELPSSSGMCASAGCCAGDVTPPAPNAYGSIDHALHRCDGGGSGCAQSQRPVASALGKSDATFTAFPNNFGGRYLILLVGGDPTCESGAAGASCPDSMAAMTNLARDSVSAAVFGVGGEIASSACLDELALLGGSQVPATPPLYHLARTPAELSAELDPLVLEMAQESCHIDIRTPPSDPDKVSVLFDGAPVDIDSANGWTFDVGSTVDLTLHGAACDALVKNAPRVEIIAGCTSPRHP